MKKSYQLVLLLAFLLVLAIHFEWIFPLKLLIIANSVLLLIDCVYRLSKIVNHKK